jgi:hypothetical protein
MEAMNESEFRDWARRAQGNFEERLKRVEEKVGGLEAGPIRFRMPEHHGVLESLLKQVRDEVSGGGVTGLGVVVVGEDGVVRTGWVSEDFARYALIGGGQQLIIAILDQVTRGALDRWAAGAAPGGTDEGRPEGAGLAGPAPAGG